MVSGKIKLIWDRPAGPRADVSLLSQLEKHDRGHVHRLIGAGCTAASLLLPTSATEQPRRCLEWTALGRAVVH